MQQHMTIIVLAASPAGLHSCSILAVKSLLNQFPLQKKWPIATNWGLISLPDCCTHFKGADQRQGEGATWMLKRLSESQWWWLPSIAFCGFKSQSIPHASSQSVPTCWQEKKKKKKLLSKVTEETYFYIRGHLKSGTVNTLLRSGCAKYSVNN